MKKILLLSALAIGLFSCKKEDQATVVKVSAQCNDCTVKFNTSPEVLKTAYVKGSFDFSFAPSSSFSMGVRGLKNGPLGVPDPISVKVYLNGKLTRTEVLHGDPGDGYFSHKVEVK